MPYGFQLQPSSYQYIDDNLGSMQRELILSLVSHVRCVCPRGVLPLIPRKQGNNCS
jgi:hypothetical protein